MTTTEFILPRRQFIKIRVVDSIDTAAKISSLHQFSAALGSSGTINFREPN
jgi:hypothetical protein